MLDRYLSASRILLKAQARGLEEAVLLCGGLLVEDGSAAPSYPAAMLATVKELGPYAVLAPGIAVPHASPECGGLRPAVALVFLKQAVPFESHNGPVRVIAGFCGTDSQSHMELLSALVPLISSPELFGQAAEAACPQDALDMIRTGLAQIEGK